MNINLCPCLCAEIIVSDKMDGTDARKMLLTNFILNFGNAKIYLLFICLFTYKFYMLEQTTRSRGMTDWTSEFMFCRLNTQCSSDNAGDLVRIHLRCSRAYYKPISPINYPNAAWWRWHFNAIEVGWFSWNPFLEISRWW